MYDIGEKPGTGVYQCPRGHTIRLDDADDVLPPCPSCGAGQVTTWTSASWRGPTNDEGPDHQVRAFVFL